MGKSGSTKLYIGNNLRTWNNFLHFKEQIIFYIYFEDNLIMNIIGHRL